MSSVLELPEHFAPTHNTDGLSGYPAVDIFGAPKTAVGAPAAGVLERSHFIPWDSVKRVGGWTTYLHDSEGVYFLTHLGGVLPSGTKVAKGQVIGTVAAVPGDAWAPHIHEGFHAGDNSAGGIIDTAGKPPASSSPGIGGGIIGGAITAGAGNAAGAIGGAATGVAGAAAGVAGGVWGVVKTPFELAAKLWELLTSQGTWVRVALFAGGLVLVLLGLRSAIVGSAGGSIAVAIKGHA